MGPVAARETSDGGRKTEERIFCLTLLGERLISGGSENGAQRCGGSDGG